MDSGTHAPQGPPTRPGPFFARLPGERATTYRLVRAYNTARSLFGLGSLCPGCRTRPGRPHTSEACPQNFERTATALWG